MLNARKFVTAFILFGTMSVSSASACSNTDKMTVIEGFRWCWAEWGHNDTKQVYGARYSDRATHAWTRTQPNAPEMIKFGFYMCQHHSIDSTGGERIAQKLIDLGANGTNEYARNQGVGDKFEEVVREIRSFFSSIFGTESNETRAYANCSEDQFAKFAQELQNSASYPGPPFP